MIAMNIHPDSTLLLFALYASYAVVEGTVKCYQCASTSLYSSWKDTWLKEKPVVFDDRCLSNPAALITSADLKEASVDCATYCFTYFIYSTSNGVTIPGIVRGCHETISGLTNSIQDNYCEQGSAAGIMSTEKYQFRACSSSNNCNSETSFRLPSNCNSRTKTVKCASCSNCNQFSPPATCEGRWCYSRQTIFNEGMVGVEKGCMPVNVFGGASCSESRSVITGLKGLQVYYQSATCFCETDDCNMKANKLDFCNFPLPMSPSLALSEGACSPGKCMTTEFGAKCSCPADYAGTFCQTYTGTTLGPLTTEKVLCRGASGLRIFYTFLLFPIIVLMFSYFSEPVWCVD